MMATTTLRLTALLPHAPDCADCGTRLRDELATSSLVEGVHLAANGDRLLVHYDAAATSPAALLALARQRAGTITCGAVHRTLPIAGLDCSDCARTLGESLCSLPGIKRAEASAAAGQLRLVYDPQQTSLTSIIGQTRSLGYEVKPDSLASLVFRVHGLDCGDCAKTLERIVAGQPGIVEASLGFTSGHLRVLYEPATIQPGTIVSRVAEAGYTAEPLTGQASGPAGNWWNRLRGREGQTAIATLMLVLGLAVGGLNLHPLIGNLFYALAVVIGGARTARAGWVGLRATRAPDMNVLMTLAVLGAIAIGEWFEAASIVVLFSLGTTLEGLTLERTRQSIARLVQLAPPTARLLREGQIVEVPADAAAVDEIMMVRPGERFPLDGTVVNGQSGVDQAPITGESVPVEKTPGDTVFAGTINGHGALTVQITRPASDTTLARIVRLVEQAQAERAPVQRFVDRFARWYTPAVLAGAGLIAIVPPLLGASFGEWFYRALVLLVIACPCALVISTPVAIVTALGSAARRGILIKGGAHLETLGRIRALAFDKTGTLTRGRPVVNEVVPLAGQSPTQVLALAAGIESRSEHPIARALVAAAQAQDLALVQPADVRALPGQGIEATLDGVRYRLGSPRLFADHPAYDEAARTQVLALEARGQTVILIGTAERILGLLAVADEPRPAARATLAALRALGLQHLVMLTGDNERVAQVIGSHLGLTAVRSNLLPEQKVKAVADLRASAGLVGMVGDGINDTPALARADVGIAMGASGTAVALETADVALMADDLRQLPAAIYLSRRTLAIIGQNIAIALAIKIIFVTLAVLGASSLWMAVLADMGGSLLVTLNALRLLRAAPHPIDTSLAGSHAHPVPVRQS